jgi:transglutaminase-like putative cysteine protease
MRTQPRVLFFTLLFFTILSCTVCAARLAAALPPTPLDAETMEARVLILNTVTLEPTSPDYHVSTASGTLTWYPRDTWLQQVTGLTTDPRGERDADSIIFNWEPPQQSETLELSATVRTRNAIVPVRQRVAFPLTEISGDAAEYLGEGDITDQSPEIQRLAQQLAAGKTDAYEVVYTLADWTTRNVNYSLASLGQPAIQRSSEVLRTRYGKCDEMTSLFISLNRALGIPARFAAGYAYTDSSQFRTGWGGHGWAEVWLPDQGWIPFDVTYGEYGYLDASHVTLKIAPDAKETSIEYAARGNDFELRTEPLDITITPTQLSERTSEAIGITLDAPHSTVDFGSSALILARVTNKRDYYVSTRLDLAKTTSTEQLSATYQNILLRPGETRVVPFLVRIDSGLQHGYAYEFPFKVYTRLGPSAAITIAVREGASFYDASAFAEEIARYTQNSSGDAGFAVTCNRGAPAYVMHPVLHTCRIIAGSGGAPTRLEVCEERNMSACVTVDAIDGAFTLSTTPARAGIATRTYTALDAKARGQRVRFFVTSRAVDQTNLSIRLGNPASVTVPEQLTIILNFSASGAALRNASVHLWLQHASADQEVTDLSRRGTMLFTVPARSLRPGENTITAVATYTDELGTPGNVTATSSVVLDGVTVFDRVTFALEDAGYWIADLFS